jgi:hypothetical protein
MITITRRLARQLQSLLRRAGFDKQTGAAKDWIALRAGSDGLRIQAASDGIAIEYHQPGQFGSEEVILPRSLLAAVEGRSDDAVTLRRQEAGTVLINWTDGNIPRFIEHALTESAGIEVKVLRLPDSLLTNPAELLLALQAATAIADCDSTRYALDCLQLRGSEGKIVTTDGRQVLVQSGFQFPWIEELLVPASKVFACRELAGAEPVDVGLIDNWVAFKLGQWSIWLAVNQHGRFPKVDDLLNRPSAATSRISIGETDAEFLQHTLGRLPNHDATNQSITLDLNGQVIVRSKSTADSRATELVLSHSTLAGDQLAVTSNRTFLAQALKLGFREVCFFGSRAPALCDDCRRQYLWALLDPEGATRAGDDPIRVESANYVPAISIDPSTRARRREPMAQHRAYSKRTPTERRHAKTSNNTALTGHSSIEQAIFVRTALRATVIHTNNLVRSLKREKRQSRLVASTLASLKQLQKVAG